MSFQSWFIIACSGLLFFILFSLLKDCDAEVYYELFVAQFLETTGIYFIMAHRCVIVLTRWGYSQRPGVAVVV